MKAVQILMDDRMLLALDRAARRSRRDRSKLVREAVARFLAAEEAREKDRQVVEAYRRQPLTREELDWLGAPGSAVRARAGRNRMTAGRPEAATEPADLRRHGEVSLSGTT